LVLYYFMNNIIGIVQARMSSTRLANKMTMEICGKTLLEHVILRLMKSKKISNIIVATSTRKTDDIIECISKKVGVSVYRGSEENVLQRFKEANDIFKGNIIVRICADSPLIDPKIIDQAIINFFEIKPDYLTTTIKRTFPKGLDVEVFSKEALNKVYELATEKYDLEHVTSYIMKHQELFNCYNLEATGEFNHPGIKLTVDTQKDFLFVKFIFESLYSKDKLFNIKDILNLLKNRSRIIFRVDGGNQLGMGDIFSMLNLAAELSDFEMLFISKYEEGINKIKEIGYDVKMIPEGISLEGEIEIIKKINENFCGDMIIIELFKKDYQEYYRKLSSITKTLVVDLFGGIEVYSDILLNWNLLSDNIHYIEKNENTIYCLDPGYTLLRKEIGKYHDLNKSIGDLVKNVLITVGGADPRNLTPKIINALKNFNDIKFNIVLGSAFRNKDEVFGVLIDSDLNYSLIKDLNDISSLIYCADLVICAGGLTSFEVSAIGTPFIGISNIEWEADRLKRMEDKGICKYLGNWKDFDEKKLHNLFKDLVNNKMMRENMSINGKKLLDGKGSSRVANIIRGVIKNGNKTNNEY